jgi:hypothetical protein
MPDTRSIVIRLTPKRRLLLLSLGILWLALLGLTFYLGTAVARDDDARLRERNRKLVSESNQLRINNRSLEDRAVNAEKAAEIDSLAAESVRQELLSFRRTIAQLHKDLAFYRSLMAPDELATGFNVHELVLHYDELSNTYTYRAIVTNAGGKGNVIQGNLSVTLHLMQDGQPVSLPLEQAVEFEGESPIKLRFRFFQTIAGSFKLAEATQPVSVALEARLKNSKAPRVYSYNWDDIVAVSGEQ